MTKLYSLRSGILHQGMLLLSDKRSLTGDHDVDWENDNILRENTRSITRVILINWIVSNEKFTNATEI